MSSDIAPRQCEHLPDALQEWESTQVREPENEDELLDWYLGVLEASI